MVLQVVFQGNLTPSSENLSARFRNATAFYISAPLINAELQIDVFLQVYFPALIGEQVRVIPLGRIEEQAVVLNIIDSETVQVIPNEFVDTNLEMALLFLASDETFIQATIVKPNYTLNDISDSLEEINAKLTTIEDTQINQLNLTLELL